MIVRPGRYDSNIGSSSREEIVAVFDALQADVKRAKDRGCSFPGCDVPGYLTEVHHVTDYAKCRTTDIDDLTQACGPHHKLVTCGAWRTRKLKTGDTEWIPPPHLDRGRTRVNTFHHPDRLLCYENEEDP